MSLEQVCDFGATSAAGAMLRRQPSEPLQLGSFLIDLGTSTAYPMLARVRQQAQRSVQATTAGPTVSVTPTAGPAISELRRLSGLTWEQLARLFNVSRRSLHFWASGKTMAPSNEEHLQRLVSTLRKVDRGSASVNRAALLSVSSDGSLPFDLLAAGNYERVLSLLTSLERPQIDGAAISPEMYAARAPRPPEELVDALHDRVHRDAGQGRAARSVRARGGR